MALKEKWTTELNEKFGLDFINIDDKDQLIHELRYHPGYIKLQRCNVQRKVDEYL